MSMILVPEYPFDASTRAAAGTLAYAIRTRDNLHELFDAIARGDSASAELARFHRALREPLSGLDVGPAVGAGGSYRWRWRGEESDPRALVWRVLWSAARLLQSAAGRMPY